MQTPKLPKLEQRIINYEDFDQVHKIVQEMSIEDFLLVEHKTHSKQLFFKKILIEPETIIIGDQ